MSIRVPDRKGNRGTPLDSFQIDSVKQLSFPKKDLYNTMISRFSSALARNSVLTSLSSRALSTGLQSSRDRCFSLTSSALQLCGGERQRSGLQRETDQQGNGFARRHLSGCWRTVFQFPYQRLGNHPYGSQSPPDHAALLH